MPLNGVLNCRCLINVLVILFNIIRVLVFDAVMKLDTEGVGRGVGQEWTHFWPFITDTKHSC